ncbi:hypothetical protein INQ51_08505 [Maribellus sp. CM-23]|uniref:Qat anti-phage system associated protein QatB n=1 Tax=Maribellus sp. CM-23 TaxID=2781026 RepID=UPI001F267577|nr:Qat anti-phage system associated protein QatB [Maribellus sp. CM-23]MCE4564351.1 hypothetical protein [Maribellus sp. CM-23]
MGTSTRYTGPSRNPLLPDDFNDSSTPDNEAPQETGEDNSNGQDDLNNNETANNQQSSNNVDSEWTAAKTNMSKYASGSSSNYKNAVSSYVKAYGGARNAAKSASSGVRSTVSFGQFLNNTSSQGIRETLSSYKIDYEGRSAKDILTDVINKIAPIPITKEDSVARKALIRTMETLYEKIEDENKDISTLEKIDSNLLNEMIPIQIESYIYERIINDLGSRIEENSSSPFEAINKEKELQEYIHSKVDTTLQQKDFTQIIINENASRDVESLYQQCYKVMEDML